MPSKDPEVLRRARKKYYEKHRTAKLLEGCQFRAKMKGLECTIKKTDLVIPDYCPILGIPIDPNAKKQSPNSPSVDRIDSTKGYTPDNVMVISWRANRLKSDSTFEEIELLYNFYKEYLQ